MNIKSDAKLADVSSEERILKAAIQIFIEKGYDGARMQEIAALAQINKALLHYYFRSKEKLFLAVFESALQKIAPSLIQLFSSEGSLSEKIKDFFELHMGYIIENPLLPGFIVMEISRHPERLKVITQRFNNMDIYQKFENLIKKYIDSGEMKQIEPVQLLLNLISLSVFPILAAPLLQGLLGLSGEAYMSVLDERKKLAAEFVIHSISVSKRNG